ncbi:hypothetical protein [Helicobacter sp. MIT 14-3879]|uniref:hypothetical protein n=1 Tax=Helicobacter sp. MIT 14-3879 TaxID=2040649 RepID=UPI0011C034EE|nr:hypothetical protein [Helicobacter sp. MIT 14-3879]
MYISLPPLFGILFLSFVKFFRKKMYYSLIAFILMLCIMESTKGFYPGILLVVYCFVYIFVFNRVVKMFKYVNIFEIFYIPIIYFMFILINSFIEINENILFFTPMVLLYIFIETIILVIRWILGIK